MGFCDLDVTQLKRGRPLPLANNGFQFQGHYVLRLFSPPHLAERARLLTENNRKARGYVFATSGTSGEPKWIIHTQESLDWCALTTNAHFQCNSQDVWGLALPEFHVGGFQVTRRARLAKGRLAKFERKWNATEFHHWLRQENVTITSLVPTQVFDLAQAKLKAPPELRIALIGGEHLDESIFEKALSLGWPLVVSYGMTETAGLIACSDVGQKTLHPLPGWSLSSDETNLLQVSGPGLFSGYLREDGIEPAPQPFTTRDLVKIENNILTPLGRRDDQIKILGELVDLAQLRKSFAATFAKHRTTVLALPDPRRGHLLQPVLEAPADPGLRESIESWNETLPAFSRCRSPHFVVRWPLTPLGKTDQQALRELVMTQIANEQDSVLPRSDKSR